MNNWEYLWVIITSKPESSHYGSGSGVWFIELPDNNKVTGMKDITDYLNKLGSEGWEQVSSTGEHIGEYSRMKSIHLFFKRPVTAKAG